MNVLFVHCTGHGGHVMLRNEDETGCVLCKVNEWHEGLVQTIKHALELLEEGKQVQASRALAHGLATFERCPTQPSSNAQKL